MPNIITENLGKVIPLPESGWTRYDNTDANIETMGIWSLSNNSNHYKGSTTLLNIGNSATASGSMRFNFTGDSFRVIIRGGYSDNTEIIIDNVSYTMINNSIPSTSFTVIGFEINGLVGREHFVTIENLSSTGASYIDAFDLSDGSELKPYNERPYQNKILLLSNEKSYNLESENTYYVNDFKSLTNGIKTSKAIPEGGTTTLSWKAFDGLEGTYWQTSGVTTGQIQIDFGVNTKVNKYKIRSRTVLNSAPKDFVLEGSNDLNEWYTLDIRSNITDWTSQTNEFKTNSIGNFRHYRLSVLSNNGTSYMAIEELQFGIELKSINYLPSHSEQNLVKYGRNSPIKVDEIFTAKNYILQDTISENAEGLWTTQLNRKPLSIKFN